MDINSHSSEVDGTAAEWPLRHTAALRLIEAACRFGSFSRAAQELGVTHSAISAAVGRIESRLGVTLFLRSGLGMKPTTAALDLAEAYRAAEHLVGRAWRRENAAGARRLTLAVPGALAAGWLGHRLAAVPRGFGLKIHAFESETTPRPTDHDLALVLASGVAPDLMQETLWEERLIPVCSPALLTRSDGAPFRERVLIHDFRAWRAWCAAAECDWPQDRADDILVDDSAVALGLALAGQGVALACQRNVRHWLQAGQLVAPFATELPTGRALIASWSPHSPARREIHRLVDWLKQEAICELIEGSAVSEAGFAATERPRPLNSQGG